MRNGRTRQQAIEPAAAAAQVRCAIYTRKSTDEGLSQEFNSLDAQREGAEAYILSQRHEGWVALPDRYDDGVFTGGNMERPALKRLMSDIETGRIDCVIVYKVDRLSWSLLDFARLMEVFDNHGVRFVAVTQQLDTLIVAGPPQPERAAQLRAVRALPRHPGDGASTAGVSEATVRRIWKAQELKPHLVATFKVSNDPQFAEKLEAIVGLYLNPPEHAIVLCVDDKSIFRFSARMTLSLLV